MRSGFFGFGLLVLTDAGFLSSVLATLLLFTVAGGLLGIVHVMENWFYTDWNVRCVKFVLQLVWVF